MARETAKNVIEVTLIYLDEAEEFVSALKVPLGSKVEDAIELSGLIDAYPNLAITKVGIYGKLVQLDQALEPGDRVEIYRPLRTNPRDARRNRAKK